MTTTRRAEGEGRRTGEDGDEMEEGWVNSLDQGRRGEMEDAGTLRVQSTKEEEQRVLRKVDKVSLVVGD
jgi:hypothetical protein